MSQVEEKEYLRGKRIFDIMQCKDLNEFLKLYNLFDSVQLAYPMDEFFDSNHKTAHLNPKMFSSMSQFSAKTSMKESNIIITGPQDPLISIALEDSFKGGYSNANQRLVFDNRMFQKEGEK